MEKLKQGLVQIYIGRGKGKTTAAFGLAMRACGWGMKVYIMQFLKPPQSRTGELVSAEKLRPHLTIERLDAPWHVSGRSQDAAQSSRMKRKIAQAFPQLKQILASAEYDIVILDEILVCLSKRLVDMADVLDLVESKARNVELVLTGSSAPPELIDRADLVTEMQEIKHPYSQGVKARKGIEY